MKGFLIDSARVIERPDYYRRVLAFMAERGLDTLLWHFTDDQGCSLIFDHLPEAASPHAWTKAQMRGFIDEARQLGIEVIPELATYGHTRYITTLPAYAHLREGDAEYSGMCPVLPETRELISVLIAEVAELFDSPWFHVGMDEVVIGSHPATAEALENQTAAQLFADHARFVHSEVTGHGKRMIMWGDHMVADPSILDTLPSDIVVAPWYYSSGADVSLVRPLVERGFDVMLCGALSSSFQHLVPGDEHVWPNLQSTTRLAGTEHPGGGKIIGQVTTVWTPTRTMHDALWPGLHIAAAFLTDGPEIDIPQLTDEFGQSFFGLSDHGEPSRHWLDSMMEVSALAPRRRDWLALLRTEPMPDETDSHESLAARWRSAHDLFEQARPEVAQNHRAFDTLSTTFDLVASLHERAVDVAKGRYEKALATTKRLLDRVERIWDQERYPNDPRKNSAAWDRDQTESLIMQLNHGLEAIIRRAAG